MGSTDALADSDVSYHRDGKTATITLSQQPGGFLSLLTNGKSDASIQVDPGNPYARDEITMTLLGSLAFAYQPDAKRVAVIGLGSGMTTHTVLAKSDVEVVDTIEIEPFVVDAAKGLPPSTTLSPI